MLPLLFGLSCFPAYATMIFEKSMDEYGVPPQRVAPLWGKGWYRRYHTIRTSRDTHEIIIVYFWVICNFFVCGDGESSLHIQRGVECGRILAPRS